MKRGVPVPDDSVAKIVSDGFLGGAHVAIEPGASEDYLQEGDKITITRGSVDLLNLAVQAFTNQSGGGQSGAGGNDNEAEDPLGDF
jgi:phospholipid/cholesterol/gamma-HCH transport system substrate-binding protein